MASMGTRLRDRIGTGGIVIAVIVIAAILFVIVSAVFSLKPTEVDIATGSHFPCTVISVYDGDGPINCAEVDAQGKQVSIRLRGIEAREPDNTCQLPVCPPMSGAQAKAVLTRLAVGRMQCVSFGPSYNRVDASCFSATGVDISCELIRRGAAERWPEYDREGRLIHCVPGRR
jgi:endonuclease YncB( thermonuclease family)